MLILSLPLKTLEEVVLCIPQGEIDSKTIVADLCATVNEQENKSNYLVLTQLQKSNWLKI